jgi:hypothetical protein
MFSDPDRFLWTIGFNRASGPRLASMPNTFQKRLPDLPAALAAECRAHVAQTIESI